jgi:hypothetical protein
MDPETFNQHSPGVILENDGTVAIHDRDRTEYTRYILGQNIYQEGTHRIRLNLETFRDHFWMFIGILKGDRLLYDRITGIRLHMDGLVHMDGDSVEKVENGKMGYRRM